MEKGQTLLEVLAAMGIGIIILTAIVIVVSTSLYNIQFSKMQNLATQYAQEGIEQMRRWRNSNYFYFAGFPNNGCLPLNANAPTPGTNCGSNLTDASNNAFRREVVMQSNLAECGGSGVNATRKVIVNVYWTDSKCTTSWCHKVTLTTCLSNFTVAPTP